MTHPRVPAVLQRPGAHVAARQHAADLARGAGGAAAGDAHRGRRAARGGAGRSGADQGVRARGLHGAGSGGAAGGAAGEPQPGESLLDACAGVGGKSTHLAALPANRASIDAADLSERKLELGAESARRMGVVKPASGRVRSDRSARAARAVLRPRASRRALHRARRARRHPEAKWRRQPEDAAELAELQAQMLDALAPRVKKVLVYSVCTFTEEEGPRQVARFVAANPDFAVEARAAAHLAASRRRRCVLRRPVEADR